jgi:hypothetical protein
MFTLLLTGWAAWYPLCAMVTAITKPEVARRIVATDLDSELFARLNAYAAKNDRNRSWVIRQAILQFLGRKSRK